MASSSTSSADQLYARFQEEFARLSEFLRMGRARPELAPELRSFPLGNYILFYRLTANGIEIVRVLNAARDIDALF